MLGGAAVDIRALDFEGDSAFQNLAEYLEALTGILGLVHLDVKRILYNRSSLL